MGKKTEFVVEGQSVTALTHDELSRLRVQGFFSGYKFEPKPGQLYTRVRAISARVNRNFDGFESEELRKAHKSFIGRPVFVNHQNWDAKRTRGMILDAQYKEDGNDKYIELLLEIDAKEFPKLATEISLGNLDSVSMGTDVDFTICSFCDNKAEQTEDFCKHVLYSKGQFLRKWDEASKQYKSALVYEKCYGLNFFEISYVFDPADETALNQEVLLPKNAKLGFGETVAPPKVDTLREEKECPECKEEFDGGRCQWCGYTEPPDELKDPDLDKAQETDLRQEEDEEKQEQGEEGSPGMPGKTRSAVATVAARGTQSARARALTRLRLDEAKARLADMSQNVVINNGDEAIADTPPAEPAVDSTTEKRNDEDADTNVLDLDTNPATRADETAPDVRTEVEVPTKSVARLTEAQVKSILRHRSANFAELDFGTGLAKSSVKFAVAKKLPPKAVLSQIFRAVGENRSVLPKEAVESFLRFHSTYRTAFRASKAGERMVVSVDKDLKNRVVIPAFKKADLGELGDNGEDLRQAQPDARVDVEAPVANDTNDYAQATQPSTEEVAQNAGDGIADHDDTSTPNWWPGKKPGLSSRKPVMASAVDAIQLAETFIALGLCDPETKYQVVAQFEKLPKAVVKDRQALLNLVANRDKKIASVQQRPRHLVPRAATAMPQMSRAASVGTRSSQADSIDDASWLAL